MAIIGFGTIISHATTSGGSYTALARISDITPMSKKRGMADTTNNESASSYEECIPGLKNGGEASMKFNYDKTQHAAIDALFESATQLYWKITYPDSSTHIGLGHISEFGNTCPLKERMESDVKIQFSGIVTFAAAP